MVFDGYIPRPEGPIQRACKPGSFNDICNNFVCQLFSKSPPYVAGKGKQSHYLLFASGLELIESLEFVASMFLGRLTTWCDCMEVVEKGKIHQSVKFYDFTLNLELKQCSNDPSFLDREHCISSSAYLACAVSIIHPLHFANAHLFNRNFNTAHRKPSSRYRREIWQTSVFYPPLQPPCNRTPPVLPNEAINKNSMNLFDKVVFYLFIMEDRLLERRDCWDIFSQQVPKEKNHPSYFELSPRSAEGFAGIESQGLRKAVSPGGGVTGLCFFKEIDISRAKRGQRKNALETPLPQESILKEEEKLFKTKHFPLESPLPRESNLRIYVNIWKNAGVWSFHGCHGNQEVYFAHGCHGNQGHTKFSVMEIATKGVVMSLHGCHGNQSISLGNHGQSRPLGCHGNCDHHWAKVSRWLTSRSSLYQSTFIADMKIKVSPWLPCPLVSIVTLLTKVTKGSTLPMVAMVTKGSTLPVTKGSNFPMVAMVTKQSDLPMVAMATKGTLVTKGSTLPVTKGSNLPMVAMVTKRSNLPMVAMVTKRSNLPMVAMVTKQSNLPMVAMVTEGSTLLMVAMATKGVLISRTNSAY
ncbi:hypothetical protein ACFE04_029096 [Oxalis oulophora]